RSMMLVPGRQAPEGLLITWPPTSDHALQVVPFQALRHGTPSPPRTKASRLPAMHDEAPGPELRLPPSDCHAGPPVANWKPATLVSCGTRTQPLSSVGVANRVCPPMPTLK